MNDYNLVYVGLALAGTALAASFLYAAGWENGNGQPQAVLATPNAIYQIAK